MTKNPNVGHPRLPLRERVRAAGGWYSYLNSRLIQVAGPASVGPYETTPPPTAEARAERGCPLCGHPLNQHTFDRSGPKPLMYCP
jgi:hypothetical protein